MVIRVSCISTQNISRVEKDNASIKHELEEIKVISDEVLRAKVDIVDVATWCFNVLMTF